MKKQEIQQPKPRLLIHLAGLAIRILNQEKSTHDIKLQPTLAFGLLLFLFFYLFFFGGGGFQVLCFLQADD